METAAPRSAAFVIAVTISSQSASSAANPGPAWRNKASSLRRCRQKNAAGRERYLHVDKFFIKLPGRRTEVESGYLPSLCFHFKNLRRGILSVPEMVNKLIFVLQHAQPHMRTIATEAIDVIYKLTPGAAPFKSAAPVGKFIRILEQSRPALRSISIEAVDVIYALTAASSLPRGSVSESEQVRPRDQRKRKS